jgi:hypothetical protein
LDCSAQVCTPPPPHWVDPFVHAFVQHAPALQAPFVHCDVIDA